MKLTIFAAALMMSGAAIAQTSTDTSSTTTAAQASTDTAAQATADAATDATSQASGGMAVAPDNSNPERDAHGVAVVSASATAPAGWNLPVGTPGAASPSASPTPQGSAGPLPPCTRKVTDHCTQTYERGARATK